MNIYLNYFRGEGKSTLVGYLTPVDTVSTVLAVGNGEPNKTTEWSLDEDMNF